MSSPRRGAINAMAPIAKRSRALLLLLLPTVVLALFVLMLVQTEAASCPRVCRTNVDSGLVECGRRLSSCRVYTCSTGGRSGAACCC